LSLRDIVLCFSVSRKSMNQSTCERYFQPPLAIIMDYFTLKNKGF